MGTELFRASLLVQIF